MLLKILIMSFMLIPKEDTFQTNVLRTCEVVKNKDLTDCKYTRANVDFSFSDSLIVLNYSDSGNITTEKYMVLKTQNEPGLVKYFCVIGCENVMIFKYELLKMVKIYFDDKSKKKSYASFFINPDKK